MSDEDERQFLSAGHEQHILNNPTDTTSTFLNQIKEVAENFERLKNSEIAKLREEIDNLKRSKEETDLKNQELNKELELKNIISIKSYNIMLVVTNRTIS